ncbi:MAG: histidine kinase [Flaviaesturariibacter sp.]|nr:histidine kinase [Flaviaesturariibacter sp.]
MKLLTKYSRVNMAAVIAIFLIASLAYYVTLSYLFVHQVDEDLQIEEQEIRAFVLEHDKLPEVIKVEDQLITFSRSSVPVKSRHFSTLPMTDPLEKDAVQEPFRQISFGVTAGGVHYRVLVSKSLEQTDRLLHSVLLISFITILSILSVSLLINRFVLKRIWRPFYTTLEKVKAFRLSSNAALQLSSSRIEEFEFMNRTLERITEQAQAEYIALKTFSENASHEMQTPLAVIRSKLDLLIQDEQLTEAQSQILQATYLSIQKLTRLNQSLLLLARIENNQYQEKGEVDLTERVDEKLLEFQELWNAQQLVVSADLQQATVSANPQLTDILLNNLLSNATRYNRPGGTIRICLAAHQLEVLNTGKAEALDKRWLYRRFYKSSDSAEQNGLGLSIIKQICDVSHFSVDYDFENGLHRFTIRWSA